MREFDLSTATPQQLQAALQASEARIRGLSRLFAVSSSVSEAIVRVREPEQLYDYACRIAVEQGELSFAWIAVRESAEQPLRMVARCGGTEEFSARVMDRINSTPAHPGPAGRALRDGIVAVTNDIATDPDFYFKESALALGLRACAVFPMKHGGVTRGIMAIYSKQVDYFRDEELRVLTALADDISFAVESAQSDRARKAATAALQENQRVMTTLFANLPGMAYRCLNDAHWTVEVISDGCLELTGYTPEQLVGNSFISYERIILPVDREMVRETVEAGLANGGSFEIVYRIVTAKGEQKWVLERGSGVYDEQGELRCLEGFITDITARREAEQQVAAQAALLDKANDAIVLYGLDETVYYWNHAAERLYGWSAQEAIGRKIVTLTCRDTTARRKLLATLLEREEWIGELTQFTKSGVQVIVDASWTLVRDELGLPQSILAINTDITERKQLEARIVNTQRMESLGTLAGGIAHDFNNILAAMSGNAKVLLAELPSSHALHIHAREIEKASLRAGELVRQILTFSRHQQSSRQVVLLSEALDESLRLLRSTLPARIEIRRQEDASTLAVLADPTQLHQVIVNLGTNAAHAMTKQGGVLTVTVDEVSLPAQRDEAPMLDELGSGRYARIAVSDTGMGMEPVVQARIFEPFFTTKIAGQGTGLGLAVVHGIVRAHGGGIVVDSVPGEGSRFSVYLPVCEIDQRPPAAMAEQISRGSGQRILYVDDEEALVFLATRVLERLGYAVTGRADALVALEEFRADPQSFDAVVSDLSMPGMSGPELAREIRSIRPDIPIVMTSGYIRDQDLNAVRELGIRELVLKPNTVEELGAALHRALSPNESLS